jgi:hypothetical protein
MIFVKLNQDNKVIERGFGNIIPDGCVEDNGQYQDCDPDLPEPIVILNTKNTRNNLLQQSDWTQIPNGPLTAEQQQAWAVYRQELRDITSQSGYPFNVIWPTPPQG